MTDTTFDLTQVAAHITGGYTRNTRANLSGEGLVKVKDAAVRKVLNPVISSSNQVSSFDPEQIKQSSNFFKFIGSWRADSQVLRNHITSYYMHNVFILTDVRRRQATNQAGVLQVDNNNNPIMEDYVHFGDSLFDVWFNTDQTVLAQSILRYVNHAEDVDRQNLAWSYEFIMNNVDADLRHYLLSELEVYDNLVGTSGPMAFYLLANKIITSTGDLAHNVISGVMALSLSHFEGEDVPECVFVLRNVLKFLNHGHPRFDRTPPTIMDYLTDVFLTASNSQFRGYIQSLKDFHPGDIATPEQLFTRAQAYYNRLVTKPGNAWLPVRKKRAAFIADGGHNDDADTANSDSPKKSYKKSDKFVIDRTPPVGNEPRTRVNEKTGKEEHWCGKCPKGGRWGNHLSKDHDQWYRDFLESKKRRENSDNSSRQSGTNDQRSVSSARPAPMRSVNVSSTPRVFMRRSYVSFQDSDDESF